ncbi:helix-turn-helix domain-containing protein [Gayadomonas joobiniege]|uniref:helix-turn-helix domain-containing protein n=1 Tax=Gayadomonas joobiniege TaxID=1234606 RepID=UPI00037F87DE|nr:hypothetical protein [Gayadomonas joobiniege]
MTSQYDINQIEQLLKPYQGTDYDKASALCQLISNALIPIADEASLITALELAEQLSEVDLADNQLLAAMLDALINNIESYESNSEKTPNQVLADLMKKHSTRQKDLNHIVPQSIISELVNHKRQLTIRHMQAFADYFNVPVSLFISARKS